MDRRLLGLLREHGVAPSQVRIEVTEGTLIENSDQVAEIIDRLHQAGVLTSLDDFGTGYSSLGYLHRFHLHAVKIDRSFVTPLTPGGGGASEAVVRAIMALARSQNLDVIAEGVETVVQRDALLGLGCHLGQGYLYSRPKPLSATTSVW
jgi:EAL domain-containing protein (putative c-di-GMP-specific phosphodiesterase class I)